MRAETGKEKTIDHFGGFFHEMPVQVRQQELITEIQVPSSWLLYHMLLTPHHHAFAQEARDQISSSTDKSQYVHQI